MTLTSIWDYLRQKTRDSVLAGFQDALDVAEQNGQGQDAHQAARKLQALLTTTPAIESGNSQAEPTEQGSATGRTGPTGGAARAQLRPAASVDDLIDAELDGNSPSASANGRLHVKPATPARGATPAKNAATAKGAASANGTQPHPARRKRGRPRKDQVQ
jgi:hypothetical protein